MPLCCCGNRFHKTPWPRLPLSAEVFIAFLPSYMCLLFALTSIIMDGLLIALDTSHSCFLQPCTAWLNLIFFSFQPAAIQVCLLLNSLSFPFPFSSLSLFFVSFLCVFFFLLQVIFKKFQILCPFEDYTANATAAHMISNISLADHGHAYHNGHVQDDAHCSPRLFTVNTQVQ